jgi:hypothetical protein
LSVRITGTNVLVMRLSPLLFLLATPVFGQWANSCGDAVTGLSPGSTNDFSGGAVSAWSTTMRGVAPSAWVYFAQNGDPLARFIATTRPRAVRH